MRPSHTNNEPLTKTIKTSWLNWFGHMTRMQRKKKKIDIGK